MLFIGFGKHAKREREPVSRTVRKAGKLFGIRRVADSKFYRLMDTFISLPSSRHILAQIENKRVLFSSLSPEATRGLSGAKVEKLKEPARLYLKFFVSLKEYAVENNTNPYSLKKIDRWIGELEDLLAK